MLWQKYVQLQVFHQLCVLWVKTMFPPTIASVTCSIIVCLYVTIRHNDVPPFLIPVFFYTAITLFGIVFWFCIQTINVSRASEARIGLLTAIPVGIGNENGISDPWELKKYTAKKRKATRAMNFRLGDFMEFSIDVPISIWEEILNQVVFGGCILRDCRLRFRLPAVA